MKKLTALFLALLMIAGFTAADEIGLTAGLEFGITDMNKPNDAEDVYPYLEASIEYENSFLDDALDIYAGLAYDIGFTKEVINEDGNEANPNGLSFEISIGYNLEISDASTLSFIMGNENYFDFVAKEDNVLGIFRPGVKFNQNIGDIGDIYVQADIPLAYLFYGLEEDYHFTGLDFTLGWSSSFGLGLEAGAHILFSPNDEMENGETYNGFTGISFTATYESGPFYTEITTTIPLKKLDEGRPYSYFDTSVDPFGLNGIAITPMISYTFDFGLSVYTSITFDKIGVDDSDVGISPAIGLTFSF